MQNSAWRWLDTFLEQLKIVSNCNFGHLNFYLQRGDTIEIIAMNPSGLWQGKSQGRIGHFKFINVELLPDRNTLRQQRRSASEKVPNYTNSGPPKTVEELLKRIGLEVNFWIWIFAPKIGHQKLLFLMHFRNIFRSSCSTDTKSWKTFTTWTSPNWTIWVSRRTNNVPKSWRLLNSCKTVIPVSLLKIPAKNSGITFYFELQDDKQINQFLALVEFLSKGRDEGRQKSKLHFGHA